MVKQRLVSEICDNDRQLRDIEELIGANINHMLVFENHQQNL